MVPEINLQLTVRLPVCWLQTKPRNLFIPGEELVDSYHKTSVMLNMFPCLTSPIFTLWYVCLEVICMPQGAVTDTCRSTQQPKGYMLSVRKKVVLHPETEHNDSLSSWEIWEEIWCSPASSTVCLDTNTNKHQSSASLAFVWGIHWWPVNSPHKGPVTRKMFPLFDNVITEICYRWRLHFFNSTWHSSYTVKLLVQDVNTCKFRSCTRFKTLF